MEKVGKNIIKAVECIKEGKVVVFPTETVYGIGANAFDEKAVEKIYVAKNRPKDNPLTVHVNGIEMVENVTKSIGEIERKLMERFWPGPLSIILKKNDNLPSIVTAGLENVSVRMPDNKYALDLITMSGVPIAAPSANISGKPSGTKVEDIYDELKDNVDFFIDDGVSKIGIESTIVKVVDGKIVILRPGKITVDDLKEITENVEIDKSCFKKVDKTEDVLSPGMKHRHYASNAKTVLLECENSGKLISRINEIIKESKKEKIAFIVLDGIYNNIEERENVKVYNLGNTMEDVCKNIFSYLRQLDKDGISKCYIQSVKDGGVGTSIMNRLIRACDYNIEKID